MTSPTHHLEAALDLLDEAQKYSRSTPVRQAVLAEAQVHATLYAAEITALAAKPVVVNQTITAAEDIVDDTPAPAPKKAPARRRMVAEGVEE